MTIIPTIIDPTAVVVAYLLNAPAVQHACGVRVAAKHKFALPTDAASRTAPDAWPFPSRCLRVQNAGGSPDIDTARQVVEMTITAFGGSQADAMVAYRALVTAVRGMVRTRVVLPDAAALLYMLTLTASPIFDYEALTDQVGIDVVTVTVRAAIAECAIP